MKCQSFPFFAAVFALTLNWALTSSHAADETVLDTATIEAVTGLKGVPNQKEGTFKISKPRDDVSVTVEQSHMAPFMGLTSWAAFMPFGKDGAAMGVNTWAAFAGTPDDALVVGDFAVLENELQTVLKTLRESNINIVAIHHHMIGENPRMLFLHYYGRGKALDLAQGVKAAINTQPLAANK